MMKACQRLLGVALPRSTCSTTGAPGFVAGYPRSRCAVQYFERNLLTYTDRIEDGFYTPMVKHRAYSSLPSLEYLLKNSGGLRDQEVMLVDSALDTDLCQFFERCAGEIPQLPSLREKFVALSNMVDDFMTRDTEDRTDEEYFQELAVSSVNNVVLIGQIERGMCRHRAVLFKYVADKLGMPSKVIRGEYWHTAPQTAETEVTFVTYGYHVWNSVLIEDAEFLCDVCRFPGTLHEPTSEVAQRYHHHEKHGPRDVRLGSCFGPL